eukprot:512038_1
MAQPNDNNENKRKCILLLGGSFSPIHKGHIEILIKIKQYLETNHNYNVISGYMVLSTDRYIAGKLNVHGMKYTERKTICDIALSKHKWIHSSHIATASADYYGEIITRSTGYKNFFNKQNSNELDDNKQELQCLVRIICMGGDKLTHCVEMMKWMASYTNANAKYCCIGRQGSTELLLKKYTQYVLDGSIKKDTFYFIGENGTSQDISSTMIREYLLTILLNPFDETNEEKKNNNEMSIVSKPNMDEINKKMKELYDDNMIEYMVKNIENLFLTDTEINQCLSRKGKVVSKNAKKKNKQKKKKSTPT